MAGPVDPCEVHVEGCLDDAEDDRDRVGAAVVAIESAPDPVENIETPVGAEEEDVEGCDDCRDRGLAEEQELGEDADRFEDKGEGYGPLSRNHRQFICFCGTV